jgi:hypothetical protein
VITHDAAYLERLRQETAVVHESKAQAEAGLKATDEDLDKLAAMVADAEHELLHVQAARDKASSELYVIQQKIGQEASLATSDLVQRAHEDASIRTEATYAFAEARTDIQDTTHLTDVPQMDTLSNHGMYTHVDLLYAPAEHHLQMHSLTLSTYLFPIPQMLLHGSKISPYWMLRRTASHLIYTPHLLRRPCHPLAPSTFLVLGFIQSPVYHNPLSQLACIVWRTSGESLPKLGVCILDLAQRARFLPRRLRWSPSRPTCPMRPRRLQRISASQKCSSHQSS